MSGQLTHLVPGQPIVYGGDRVTSVPAGLAAAFVAGDRLVVVHETGDLLHIPSADHETVTAAVDAAVAAFAALVDVTDEQITAFFVAFADRLGDDALFAAIAAANAEDVADARARGRATGRLELSPSMRASMIDGLRTWSAAPTRRAQHVATTEHDGWSVEAWRDPLGVVGFVFEGRPNVFADATGVLRTGNTAVFRIGSDALRTARAIMATAVVPSLAASGLPAGAVQLVDAPARAAGWALFADARLSLAVARGSGPGGRPARRRRPPARRAGQPARHRRCLARRRRRGRRRRVRSRGPPLTRPQGVQHAQRLLHRRRPRRRPAARVPRRGAPGGSGARGHVDRARARGGRPAASPTSGSGTPSPSSPSSSSTIWPPASPRSTASARTWRRR